MSNPIMSMARLIRAGWIIAKHGVRVWPKNTPMPWPARVAQTLFSLITPSAPEGTHGQRLTKALAQLGPSYIKLGQFLATRDDLVGKELARDLSQLQDRLPPFSMKKAKAAVEEALGAPASKIYDEFGEPVAAASIAQVHKAWVEDNDGRHPLAVKILRPGVEQQFQNDLDSFFLAANLIERVHKPSRRLRPIAVVQTLADSVDIEMDLRMEAAAMSEMAENIAKAGDHGFRIPKVDWSRSAKRVMTLEWIDGIPMSDVEALKAAGHDLKELGTRVIRSFLRHAMRDGFFHADMHQGNLFVDKNGDIVAVDFGIMGRLTFKEQRFLAEILHGFLTRNYTRIAEVHFEAGYVPDHHPTERFAQALRSIGEPLMDRTAEEISMGRLLGQLFQVTEMFDMQTRPELIMLQKTMVVVEGVARTLDPELNIWTAAEPVAKEWMETNFGAEGHLHNAAEGAASIGKFVGVLPGLLSRAERTAQSLSNMAADGIRLDQHSIERLAEEQAKKDRFTRTGIWIGAISLLIIAIAMMT